jgi:hypothetical protein
VASPRSSRSRDSRRSRSGTAKAPGPPNASREGRKPQNRPFPEKFGPSYLDSDAVSESSSVASKSSSRPLVHTKGPRDDQGDYESPVVYHGNEMIRIREGQHALHSQSASPANISQETARLVAEVQAAAMRKAATTPAGQVLPVQPPPASLAISNRPGIFEVSSAVLYPERFIQRDTARLLRRAVSTERAVDSEG